MNATVILSTNTQSSFNVFFQQVGLSRPLLATCLKGKDAGHLNCSSFYLIGG